MARARADRTGWTQSVPTKPQKRRFRRLRRVLVLFLILAGCLLGARLYILHVYAPGLRAEVRYLPAIVQDQLGQHNAQYLRLDQISPRLQQAIVAIEDRRFYSHPGIDPQGMIRAAWVNLKNEHVDQGGSTLEEQLVKRAILQKRDTIRDKLRTVALAWAVDQEFTKQQILEMYLNAAYYGQGAYGAGAAARTYFGTDVAQLTLPQAALLAALPQAPSIYGANLTSGAVIRRQQTVLRDMRELGDITAAQEQAADNTRLTFAFPNP